MARCKCQLADGFDMAVPPHKFGIDVHVITYWCATTEATCGHHATIHCMVWTRFFSAPSQSLFLQMPIPHQQDFIMLLAMLDHVQAYGAHMPDLYSLQLLEDMLIRLCNLLDDVGRERERPKACQIPIFPILAVKVSHLSGQ